MPGQWSCVTSHKQGEEMWRGRHCSMFSKTSLHTSTSHAADLPPPVPGPPRSVHRLAIGQGQGWGILPHLTTLIIQDLVLVPGSGQGGTQPWADHLQTMDQISNMIYAGNQSSFKTIFVISYRHLSYNDNIRVVRHSEQQNNR